MTGVKGGLKAIKEVTLKMKLLFLPFSFCLLTYINLFHINATAAVKKKKPSIPVPHLPSPESALFHCRSTALPRLIEHHISTRLSLSHGSSFLHHFVCGFSLKFSIMIHVLIPITSFIPSIPFLWGHDATQVYVYSPSGFICLINLHTHSIRRLMERTAVSMPQFHMNFTPTRTSADYIVSHSLK